MNANTTESDKKFLDSMYVLSHSEFTVKTYRTAINKLREFLNDTYQIDEIQLKSKINENELDIYELLRDFSVYLDKQDYKSKSIRGYLNGTKGYLRHLGFKIYSEDCRYLVKTPKDYKTQDKAITKEMIVRLLRTVSPKLQAAILVAISTGMRIGEIVQLRLTDIDFTKKPTRIRIRAETTKTRTGRDAFLTSEASKALKDYLTSHFEWIENGKNEHIEAKPIFGRTSKGGEFYGEKKVKPSRWSSELALQQSLKKYIQKIPELNQKNENGRMVIHWHVFRKFFRTTVGDVVGRDFAEAIIGHKFYMDTYYTQSDEKRRESFLKVEPHLTISDYQTIEKNIQDISTKCALLENKMKQFELYLQSNSIPVPAFIQ